MRVKTTKTITNEERDLVVSMVKRCLREMKKKQYEIPAKTVGEMYARVNLTVKAAGVRSRAGRDRIVIDISEYRAGLCRFNEYAAFNSDPVIGGAVYKTPEDALFALVAHEMSHHIQYAYGPHTRWLRRKYRKPHGEGFQAIYRILRLNLVNPNKVS